MCRRRLRFCRMVALLGTTPEHVMAGRVVDFIFSEDIPAMRERIGSNLAGRTEEFDFRLRRADGAKVLVLAGTSPVEPPDPVRLETALVGIDTAAGRMNRLLDELGDITRLRAGRRPIW